MAQAGAVKLLYYSVDVKEFFVVDGERRQTDVVMDLLQIPAHEWVSETCRRLGIAADRVMVTVMGIPCETFSWADLSNKERGCYYRNADGSPSDTDAIAGGGDATA